MYLSVKHEWPDALSLYLMNQRLSEAKFSPQLVDCHGNIFPLLSQVKSLEFLAGRDSYQAVLLKEFDNRLNVRSRSLDSSIELFAVILPLLIFV